MESELARELVGEFDGDSLCEMRDTLRRHIGIMKAHKGPISIKDLARFERLEHELDVFCDTLGY